MADQRSGKRRDQRQARRREPASTTPVGGVIDVRAKLRETAVSMRVDEPRRPAPAFPPAARVQLRVLQQQFDGWTKHAAAQSRCRPGCSACCEQHVSLTQIEAAAMVAAFEAKHGADALQGLVDAARERGERTRGLTVHEYWLARLPCLFLRDGLCDVHEVRPMGCRAFFVVSDPTLCAERNASPESAQVMFLRCLNAEREYRDQAKVLDRSRPRSLHAAVLEVLAARAELAPNEGGGPT